MDETKQIVISPSENLFNLYWFIKYMDKKNIKVYPYRRIIAKDYNTKGYKFITEKEITDDNNDKSNWCKLLLLKKDKGDWLEASEEKVCHDSNLVIYHFEYEKNREDTDLIKVTKERNNEEFMKIVNIPKNVEYHIESEECDIGEIIVESHRTWK